MFSLYLLHFLFLSPSLFFESSFFIPLSFDFDCKYSFLYHISKYISLISFCFVILYAYNVHTIDLIPLLFIFISIYLSSGCFPLPVMRGSSRRPWCSSRSTRWSTRRWARSTWPAPAPGRPVSRSRGPRPACWGRRRERAGRRAAGADPPACVGSAGRRSHWSPRWGSRRRRRAWPADQTSCSGSYWNWESCLWYS